MRVECLLYLPIKIGFLSFDINRIDRIQTKPRGEGETIFMRPFR